MKTLFILSSILLRILLPTPVVAVEQAPRITDREIIERLTRLEEGQKSLGQRSEDLEQRMNQRFESLKEDLGQRIEAVRELVLWGFGVMFAGMFALVGFVVWDRRSALAPAVHRLEEL